MSKRFFRLSLLAFALWLTTGSLIYPVQAQLVREIDLNCTPALTPRSELLFPYIDEYIAAYGADVSPDGKYLAIVAVNRVVLFDTKTFEPVQQIGFEPEYWDDYWRVLAWAPDGERLAAYIGPRNGTLILNTTTAEIEQRLPTSDELTTMRAFTLAWSPDGSKLAALGTIPWRVWDVASNEVVYEATFASNARHVFVLSPEIYGRQHMAAWSPDGSQLAIPDEREVVLLDTTTWSEEVTLPMNASDLIVSLEWSDAGRLYVTEAYHYTLAVWNPASGEKIAELHPGPGYVAQLSLDQRLLAAAYSRTITILNADTLEPITTLNTALTREPWGVIVNLHWLDDHRVIVYYGEYSLVEVWNIDTGVMEHTWHVNCN